MNILSAIGLIANFLWSIINLLTSRLRFGDGAGHTISYISVVVACIVISAFISLFYRGSKG